MQKTCEPRIARMLRTGFLREKNEATAFHNQVRSEPCFLPCLLSGEKPASARFEGLCLGQGEVAPCHPCYLCDPWPAILEPRRRWVKLFRLFLAELLEARILSERIEHRIEPKQRRSKRRD